MTLDIKGSSSGLSIDGPLSMSHSFYPSLRTEYDNVYVDEVVPLYKVSATRQPYSLVARLSLDGNTMVVSSPTSPNNQAHTRYNTSFITFYTKVSGTWIQEEVQYMDNYIDYATEVQVFGRTTSISGNGMVAATGDFRDATGGDYVGGKVYVYKRSFPTGIKNRVASLTKTSGGTGYIAGQILQFTGGTGTGVKILITTVDVNGSITAFKIVGRGNGYTVSDSLTATSGSASFTVSTVFDGSIWTQETIVPSDLLSNYAQKRFGCSVSLSYDGKTIAIGAFGDGQGGYFSGAASIYVRQSGAWVLQQKILNPTRINYVSITNGGSGYTVGQQLNGTSGSGKYAKFSVASTSSGVITGVNILSRGFYYQTGDVISVDVGSAQFTVTGTYHDSNTRFGTDVSISHSGNQLIVGAPYDTTTGGSGSAGVSIVNITNGGSGYTVGQLITPPATTGSGSGATFSVLSVGTGGSITGVSITSPGVQFSPGDTLVDSTGGASFYVSAVKVTPEGSAYTFTRSGSVWSFDDKLTHFHDLTISGPLFGTTVKISPDGTIALLSGSDSNDNTMYPAAHRSGVVHVFKKSGGVWTFLQKLSPNDFGDVPRINGMFGIGLSISYDNSMILVGGPNYGTETFGTGAYSGVRTNVTGACFVYKLNNNVYSAYGSLRQGGATGQNVDIDQNYNIVSTMGAGFYYYPVDNTSQPFTYRNQTSQETLDLDFKEMAFSYDVSISSSGNTILSGVPMPTPKQKIQTGADPFLDKDNMQVFPIPGSAYVYEKSGNLWSIQKKLIPSDSMNDDQFGISTCLSSDGNTAFIGSSRSLSGLTNTGALYIFTRSGNVWTQVQKITPTDGIQEGKFGYRSRCTPDGNTVFVSCMNYSGSTNRTGCVYVYKKNITWDFSHKILSDSNADNTLFGGWLDVSRDGSVLAIGKYNDVSSPVIDDFDILIGKGTGVGEVQIYKPVSNVWTKTTSITRTASNFGRRFSLNNDGSVIAISAERDVGSLIPSKPIYTGIDEGAVYVYSFNGSSYVLDAKVKPVMTQITCDRGLYFGSSISLNSGGDVFIVGADVRGATTIPATLDPSNGDQFGVAYIYKKVNGVWTMQNLIRFKKGMYLDRSGWSSALSSTDVFVIGSLSIQQNQLYILR